LNLIKMETEQLLIKGEIDFLEEELAELFRITLRLETELETVIKRN